MRRSWDDLWISMARELATMGTCHRRQVGCVLVDSKNHVLGTGFNGVPPGWPHCRESERFRCAGANAPSGEKLDGCEASHAEQNALAHCIDRSKIYACYCTVSPCVTCVKELLQTPCSRIIFSEEYPHAESRERWIRYNVYNGILPRTWEKFNNGATITLASSLKP